MLTSEVASNRMIAKISLFVIFAGFTSGFFSGCTLVSSGTTTTPPVSSFGAPKINGQIKSADLTESSGIAASKCQNNVLWTHNDSGDDAFVFAINSVGENLGKWKIPNAQNVDWEDIATYKDKSGNCFIYIGEIGDNKAKRPEHSIIRVAEPAVTKAVSTDPHTTAESDSLQFSYPDSNQDAETLMVHPNTGDIYVVTKRVTGPAGIYRIRPDFGSTLIQKAERIGELSVPAIPNGFLTGGDISPDGRTLIICDYTQAYEYRLPATETDFAKVWIQEPETVDLGKRKGGEAICYSADGASLFATSEGRNSPVIEVRRSSNSRIE